MRGWRADVVVPAPAAGVSTVQTVLMDSLEKLMGRAEPRPASLIGGVHASGFLGERLSVQIAVRLEAGEGCADALADGAGERPAPRSAGMTAAVEVELLGDLAAHTTLSGAARAGLDPRPRGPR
ncbi:hypothetical protein M3C58_08105 [Brachybacterium muris]|uniref:hypothetical protein n=1 Tax=Brachybacterium TaxID=43668 RepID=UPI0021AA277C|nr:MULTISPECIES: hypothetical protein [Brachybacterium]MCT1384674.1 hypothetical protein [Brachybacterium sp. p3-SID1565]MCT1998156.1 hypothetical protein [Brachybacterium muris]MCT2176390.1 hypothetical protein [Brachybacterium muris]